MDHQINTPFPPYNSFCILQPLSTLVWMWWTWLFFTTILVQTSLLGFIICDYNSLHSDKIRETLNEESDDDTEELDVTLIL